MDKRNDNSIPISAKEKEGSTLLWRQEDDKHILLARHDMYVMNEFSKEIFELCDGTKSVHDLAEYCSKKYDVDISMALENIWTFIDFATSRNLMEIKND